MTSSCSSWLPKPPKRPDNPASLRPIGVVAPEGKILAGLVLQRLKATLKAAMSEVAQFGSAPGRGTEETICKSLAHIDEARARTATDQRVAGQGTRGVKLKGSPTLSVDMGKAFDTVYRVRVREALEVASADPFLIDVVGKLHTETFYEMTTSARAFSIATRRGIKQACKLAPSFFACSSDVCQTSATHKCSQGY